MPSRPCASAGKLKARRHLPDNVVFFRPSPMRAAPGCASFPAPETELPDEDVPPYTSGLAAGDRAGWEGFHATYRAS
jgi:hypothetical protein